MTELFCLKCDASIIFDDSAFTCVCKKCGTNFFIEQDEVIDAKNEDYCYYYLTFKE